MLLTLQFLIKEYACLLQFSRLTQEIFPPCSIFVSCSFGVSQGDRLELHYYYLHSALLALKFFLPCLFILVYLPFNFGSIPCLLVYSGLLVYSELENRTIVLKPIDGMSSDVYS